MFDLFITLTDWEAERHRPRFMVELAAALDVDPLAFSSLMRETFTARVAGEMGDAGATFAMLATRLGCELSAGKLEQVMAMRQEQTRATLAPRAGVLDTIDEIRTAGYAIGAMTDCTVETPYCGRRSRTRPWWTQSRSRARSGTGSLIRPGTRTSRGSSASRPKSVST